MLISVQNLTKIYFSMSAMAAKGRRNKSFRAQARTSVSGILLHDISGNATTRYAVPSLQCFEDSHEQLSTRVYSRRNVFLYLGHLSPPSNLRRWSSGVTAPPVFSGGKGETPVDLLAEVIFPDHLHCLWCLPEGDADFSTRWQMVKTGFSRRIPAKTRKEGA